MARRTPVVPTLVAAAAIAIAACGGPTASPIDDPIDILVESVRTLEEAKTVHLELTLDGELPLDLAGGMLPGAGGSGGTDGGTLDIGGTTVEGDVDIENQAAQLAFTIPALLNISGELIVVDEVLYLKASLLGDKYQAFDGLDTGSLLPDLGSPAPSGSPAATDPAGELRAELEKLDPPPVKLPDEKCGDTDCYRVQIELDTTDAGPLASLAPDAEATGTLDVWVRKDDLRPSQLTITVDAAEQGNLTATLVLSDWDKPVTIEAPPEDQVEEGQFDPSELIPGATG